MAQELIHTLEKLKNTEEMLDAEIEKSKELEEILNSIFENYSIDMEIRDIKLKYSISDKDINSWIKSKGKVSKGTEIMALKNIEMEEKIKNKIKWKFLIDRVLKYYESYEQEKYLYIKYRYFEKCSTTKIDRKMAICRATQARIKSDIVYYIALYAVKDKLIKMDKV